MKSLVSFVVSIELALVLIMCMAVIFVKAMRAAGASEDTFFVIGFFAAQGMIAIGGYVGLKAKELLDGAA